MFYHTNHTGKSDFRDWIFRHEKFLFIDEITTDLHKNVITELSHSVVLKIIIEEIQSIDYIWSKKIRVRYWLRNKKVRIYPNCGESCVRDVLVWLFCTEYV